MGAAAAAAKVTNEAVVFVMWFDTMATQLNIRVFDNRQWESVSDCSAMNDHLYDASLCCYFVEQRRHYAVIVEHYLKL